jgi:hypothetical protein
MGIDDELSSLPRSEDVESLSVDVQRRRRRRALIAAPGDDEVTRGAHRDSGIILLAVGARIDDELRAVRRSLRERRDGAEEKAWRGREEFRKSHVTRERIQRRRGNGKLADARREGKSTL